MEKAVKFVDQAFHLIQDELFPGYTIFLLLLGGVSLFTGQKKTEGLEISAANLTGWISMFYLVFWALSFAIERTYQIRELYPELNLPKINWVSLLIFSFSPAFLLRWEKIRTKRWLRFLLAIPLLGPAGVLFERYVIIVTSLHRDSIHTANHPNLFSLVILVIFLKVLAFTILFALTRFGIKWNNKCKETTT